MQTIVVTQTLARTACWVVLLTACFAGYARGQSLDIAWPSPIVTNEVTGTISARDIGDPRLTDYYYAFAGAPGDLLITVESGNLNGDIDVFTASGLRPLLKFTVYAGSSSPMTKSIYFRKREELILRVEGRSPNDDEGTYRLHFGGSFEPLTSGPLLAASENAPPQPATPAGASAKKGRRVSSVGARIDEPAPPEVAAAPTPEAAPSESTETKESKAAVPRDTTATSKGRGRRPAGRRTRSPEPVKAEATSSKTENESKPPPNEAPVIESTTPKSGRRSTRRGPTARSVAKTPVETEPESGPRLLIETSDGTLINRYMSSVRRVIVENGQVVVVGKDGKIERIPLATVLRMTISP